MITIYYYALSSDLTTAINTKASTAVATQSANGLMSLADKTKLDYIPNAHYTYRGAANSKIKIKINSRGFMIAFTINIYAGYRALKIMVSGYDYSSSQEYWYQPEAVILGDSNGDDNFKLYFGYDAASELWVGFDLSTYAGVSVTDVAMGFDTITTDYSNLFTISRVDAFGGTTQHTITAYTSAYNMIYRANHWYELNVSLINSNYFTVTENLFADTYNGFMTVTGGLKFKVNVAASNDVDMVFVEIPNEIKNDVIKFYTRLYGGVTQVTNGGKIIKIHAVTVDSNRKIRVYLHNYSGQTIPVNDTLDFNFVMQYSPYYLP